MQNRFIFSLLLICCGCSHLPKEVPDAPHQQAGAVVFDIDGTLTPTVMKYQIVRKHAARAAQIFASQGYEIIYLSARVPFLQNGIPDWLKENGFPRGSIHVIDAADYLKNHAKFKKAVLRKFQAKGWKVVFAYGDSSTDFEAYADVGIPQQHVFALRREGDNECQPGTWQTCLNGWAEHINSISQLITDCKQPDGSVSQSC